MHDALETSSAPEMRTRVVLDVRLDIRNGREPYSKIMSGVAALQADQDLCLLACFRAGAAVCRAEKAGVLPLGAPTAVRRQFLKPRLEPICDSGRSRIETTMTCEFLTESQNLE